MVIEHVPMTEIIIKHMIVFFISLAFLLFLEYRGQYICFSRDKIGNEGTQKDYWMDSHLNILINVTSLKTEALTRF